jgi:hypothetical protein
VTPSPSTPAGRLGRYRVGLAVLVWMLAGRTSYRLVLLATTIALLPVWGEQRYGVYAAATASLSWLLALVVAGPEKTVLKLRPRAARTGAELSDALLAVLWWAPLPLAAGFAGTLLTRGTGDPATLYVGVATMQLSIGCTLLLVALHRAAGRPRPDAVTFLAMSATQLALLGVAAAGHLGPVGYVAVVSAAQLAINLVLTASLGRPSLRIRRRRLLLRRLGWTALLLGSAELYVYVPTAVLFVILAASAHAADLPRLFVVLIAWSAAVNLLLYVFRVHAPRTSLRLAGRGARAGRAHARRLARTSALLNGAWLAGMASLLVIADVTGVTDPVAQTVLWVVLLATRAPAFGTLLWATYQLENTDATAPRLVAGAALAGTAVTTVCGFAAVTMLGAIGVIVSFAVGEVVYASVIAARAGRPDGARAATPAVLPAPPAPGPSPHAPSAPS